MVFPMLRAFILLAALVAATPSFAARCGGDFNTFVSSISQEAAAAGVSQSVIASALGGVTVDQSVLNFDRRQRYTFNKSFEQYVSTRVGAGRINGGRAMLQRNAALLASIEANSACRGRYWWRSGGWRPISARAIWANCRDPHACDHGA